MQIVIQRVQWAKVEVDGREVGAIGKGLLLLVGIERGDQAADAMAAAAKIQKLRCFPDRTPMDQTTREAAGGFLAVSQFTLCAELAAGNRPSFSAAEDPTLAQALFDQFVDALRGGGCPVATGVFGAKMAVSLCNDGPVTFLLRVRDGRAVKRPDQA